jgi:hypothetical protein
MELIRGRVKIPKDYFNRAAKKEYVFWGRALLREFLQNSTDAGSTEINFRFSRDRLSLVVQDNGCGMDKNVILDKLLALGGTYKQSGAIGGFGKAKEILFFAWKKYAIFTKNWLVEGEGPEYTLKNTGKRYNNGTKCLIRFYTAEEFNIALAAATEYLPRNEIKPNIYINSNRVHYRWKEKKKAREFDWGTVYTYPGNSSEVSIRVSGLEMFKRHIFVGLKKGVIVELKDYSTKVLTSNRDGLNGIYNSQLQSFITDLSANPLSAVMDISKDIREVVKSRARAKVPESLQIMWHGKEAKNTEPWFTTGVGINKSEFSFENFDYDLFIRRSNNFNIKKIREFMSDPVAEPFAKIWVSILFEIVLANKIPIQSISPGFIFHDGIEGMCQGDKDNPIIYVNPLSKKVLESSGEEIGYLVEVLEDIAYHELAHTQFDRHTEQFVICSENYRSRHRIWKRTKCSPRVFNWNKKLRGGTNESF